MSKRTIELALGLDDPAEAAALAEWAAAQRATEAAVPGVPEWGPVSGTMRILVAAVQRLAEENAALAEENDALKTQLEGLTEALAEANDALRDATATVEITGPDGETTVATAAFDPGADAIRAEVREAVEAHRAQVAAGVDGDTASAGPQTPPVRAAFWAAGDTADDFTTIDVEW